MSSSLETGVGHDKKPATANSFDVDSSPPAGKTTSLSMAANLLGGTQIVLFFLFGLCAKISFDASFQKTHGTVTEGYNMFIGVEIMMFIGFGESLVELCVIREVVLHPLTKSLLFYSILILFLFYVLTTIRLPYDFPQEVWYRCSRVHHVRHGIGPTVGPLH
jgi:hypothetical protein